MTQPADPTSFPSVWNGTGRFMMPSLFAVWFPAKEHYQLYKIDREEWPTYKFEETNSARERPFYFAVDPNDDRQSRTITLYRPRARLHSHVQLGIWFTGGWLCKNRANVKVPVVPILAVSDVSKLHYSGSSVSVEVTMEYMEWKTFQTAFHYRPIAHNRIPEANREVVREVEVAAAPKAIPEFVAAMLLKKAQEDGQLCPISMDAVWEGKAAVTSCFHVFDRESLGAWHDSHGTCPLCKQACAVTPV
jgi:hypothetical protein